MPRLLKIIGSVGLVCLVALLFQYFFERKIILGSDSSAAFKINRVLYNKDKNEIPIFGPSTAQCGFIPGILGPNYFNYGIDGVREDVLLFFLEEECKKQKANSHIIAVISLDGFNYSLGDMNNYILNSNNPDVQKLLGEHYQWYYKVPFVKYYGQYDSYLKDFLNERMMLTKYKDRGASIEKDVLTKEKFNSLVADRKNTTSRFNFDSVLDNRFVDLIKKYPKRNFIIMIPPTHPSYFFKYENYPEAQHFLSYLGQFPNVKVLDYSHNFYPDDCYLNTSHLNYKGAVLFNNLIKDTLQKITAAN